MTIYHACILGFLVFMLCILGVNLVYFRRLRPADSRETYRHMSVLIPARNEAGNIEHTVRSLLRQNHPHFEIIVLDDGSSDGTGERACEVAGGDPRFRLMAGSEPPQGWTGKNWACHLLAGAARGDILLFTDADTTYCEDALRKIDAALRNFRVDVLSLVPSQRMETFWKRVFMPMLQFVPMTILPTPLVTLTRFRVFTMANGQCLAFTRKAYQTIGGHETVCGAIVEDVWLARAAKRAHFRVRVMAGEDTVECRMYDSLGGIVRGFSKNIFPGFRYSLVMLAAVVLFNISTQVAPYGFLLAGPDAPWFPLVVAQVGVLTSMRAILAVKFRQPLMSIFLHPVAVTLLVSIALRSAWQALFGAGSEWKGRRYTPPHRGPVFPWSRRRV
ncbi:MAG: glycosyltransferase family 2 protein [Bacteroidota bacterium]|nr:glycosyltransferase family 2 protein [Bacteroidota bacterium]